MPRSKIQRRGTALPGPLHHHRTSLPQSQTKKPRFRVPLGRCRRGRQPMPTETKVKARRNTTSAATAASVGVRCSKEQITAPCQPYPQQHSYSSTRDMNRGAMASRRIIHESKNIICASSYTHRRSTCYDNPPKLYELFAGYGERVLAGVKSMETF